MTRRCCASRATSVTPCGATPRSTPVLTRTPRGLPTVRMGHAYQRRRAACPEAPRTVRTGYAYQPRVCCMYRVPWHHR
eukprot:scaffold118480_cov75-Phaeocystis_antarctica.AAC.2